MKLGKLPARANAITFRLRDYLALTTLPTPPPTISNQHLRISWGMLGNDQYGDCVWAGAGHETMLWNAEVKKTVVITDQNALSDYAKVTGFNPADPNTDQGTDMQVAASYRRKTGIVDNTNSRHKVTAYLSITPGNRLELKQAIYLFSNIGIGIQFPQSAMSQFNAGKPWTVVASSPIEGGHYIPAIGYDAKYIYIVTWGKVQKMSWSFFTRYCDEAIVYLSPEFLLQGQSPAGFNLTQLQADLAALK